MIDYIQATIKGITVEELYNNPLLDFICPISITTGELQPTNKRLKKNWLPIRKELRSELGYMNLTVINDKYIRFEGSLHEYFHSGNNSGDFNVSQLKKSLQSISNSLHISLDQIELHNVEFGVNIRLPFSAKLVLDSIFFYKGHSPEVLRRYHGKGYLKKFILEQYELKIYDKGKQYRLDESVLRIEIKVRRMKYLTEKGINIHTFADLLNPNFHVLLEKILVDAISSIVITDSKFSELSLTKNEKRLLNKFDNPRYWSSIWSSDQNKFRKSKSKFAKLISNYGNIKFQENLIFLARGKWQQLTDQKAQHLLKSSTEITDLINCN